MKPLFLLLLTLLNVGLLKADEVTSAGEVDGFVVCLMEDCDMDQPLEGENVCDGYDPMNLFGAACVAAHDDNYDRGVCSSLYVSVILTPLSHPPIN